MKEDRYPTTNHLITDELIARVADEANAHTRTVERRLLGLRVKGRVAIRVDTVLERHGLGGFVVATNGLPSADTTRP